VTDDEAGQSRGYRLAVTDITERKAAEKKLRQFNIELEQRVAARTAELKAANDALRASRVAALNLAEDAVQARKREELVTAQLRESERQFRTLADSIPNLAWCANGDGYITWYNRRWYEYTGTTPEQVEGWGWQSLHDPEVLPKVLEQWRRSIATGEPFEMEFPLRGCADGRFRWFLTRSLPVKDADGKVVSWFGTNTDVTEQREAGEAIRRGEALLTQAVRVAGLGIFEHDHRSDRIEYSPHMRELLGLGKDQEITVASFLQRVVPEDRAALAEAIHRAHDPAGDGMFGLDYRIARADGRVRWLSTRAQTFFQGEGSERRPCRTVGAAVDVTEHRQFAARLERAVAERTAELRDTNEQLETFVYSIAHDLRSPLRSMTGFSQLLLDDYAAGLGETGQNLLQRIQASSEFMDKLLLDLLAFGRTSRVEMELGPVAVQKAWDAALFQCATQVEQARAQVEAVSPLPAVRAHEATLAQCLANLLSNALKFVAPGVQPSIRFRAEDYGSWVRLWLEDNGIGIPVAQHERVFRVFERLHGSRYPGTGIGLSIVRKGAERMGGKVGLESEPGKGSRFWIELAKVDGGWTPRPTEDGYRSKELTNK
jgi:PAS domain S-box-containing protein